MPAFYIFQMKISTKIQGIDFFKTVVGIVRVD